MENSIRRWLVGLTVFTSAGLFWISWSGTAATEREVRRASHVELAKVAGYMFGQCCDNVKSPPCVGWAAGTCAADAQGVCTSPGATCQGCKPATTDWYCRGSAWGTCLPAAPALCNAANPVMLCSQAMIGCVCMATSMTNTCGAATRCTGTFCWI